MRFRFTIRDLLWLTLVVACMLGVFQLVWDRGSTNALSPWSDNARLIYSINIAVLAIASAGGLFGKAQVRRFAIGYAFFGWPFLIFVLHSISLDDYFNQALLSKFSMLGAMLGTVCGLACHGLLRPPKDITTKPQ
jgi:hypothetical protein